MRGDKVVLVQQVRGGLLLSLGLLLGLSAGLLVLLLSRERLVEKGRGRVGLLVPIRDTIGTGAQSRSVLLRRGGMQPLMIVLGLLTNCVGIVK